ncbi:MAG: AsmA-like C-terminal region-containing protein [Bacteroidales bacterium]|nr:AsmA-like C-terminal region-containing protein [Bacteroidales bacterium]
MSQEKKKRKALRIVLKSLMWTAISLVSLVLIAALLVYIFSDKIEQKVIERINQDLNTEIQVVDIRVSLFYDFPNISVVFEDLVALDATPEKEGHLFDAKEAALEFNLFSIIFGEYNIRKIYLSEGAFIMKRYEDGSDNYHFLKEDTTAVQNIEAAEYDLRHIEVKNMGFTFLDLEEDQQYSFYVHDMLASGEFSEDVFQLSASGSVRVDTLYTEGMYFAPGREASIDALLDVNTTQNFVEFNNADINLDEVNFKTHGRVDYGDSVETVDISVEAQELAMKDMISLLPERLQNYFADFKQQGSINFKTRVYGKYSSGEALAVDVQAFLSGGALERTENKLSLENISFNAYFSAPDISKPTLYTVKINDFTAMLDGKKLEGRFMMKNLKSPETKLQLSGELSLEKLKEWAEPPMIKTMKGLLTFDVSFEGKIKDPENITMQDFINSKSAGDVLLQDAELEWVGSNYALQNIQSEAMFSNRDLEIISFSAIYGKSDIEAEGWFRDFIPFFFLPDQRLKIGGKIHSKHLDVYDIFSSQGSSQSSGDVEIKLPDNILATITLDADHLEYKKFGASNVHASVQFKDQKLYVDRIKANTLGGSIFASGLVDASLPGKVNVSCDADFDHLDIREALIAFDEFGQTSLTSENIRGITNTHLQFSAVFSRKLEIKRESITAVAEVEVLDGELVGYEPLNGLKQVLKNRDFSHIEFDRLRNTISIQNEKISIPKMEIKSSAMNLKLSGTHTFDNVIDYHLEIKFSDLKNNQNENDGPESEYGYVEDDGIGDPTIFILVTGTVDDPHYKRLDKQAIKEKVKEDIQEEKKVIKKILNDEFGFFKKDSTLKDIEEPKKQETKFIIEWDEE